jgi:hypothetical protein
VNLDPEPLYVALIGDPARLGKLRRLQYRCDTERRCLLLDAVATGDTILLHQKRFKNSDAVNKRRSNEAGRARNTFDGDRHWLPRSYFIGQSALAHPDDRPTPRLSLQCDHVGVLPGGDDLTLSALDFHDDWDAGRAEVRVRADGTRYAVT